MKQQFAGNVVPLQHIISTPQCYVFCWNVANTNFIVTRDRSYYRLNSIWPRNYLTIYTYMQKHILKINAIKSILILLVLIQLSFYWNIYVTI